jgi:adenylosuccinate synthase
MSLTAQIHNQTYNTISVNDDEFLRELEERYGIKHLYLPQNFDQGDELVELLNKQLNHARRISYIYNVVEYVKENGFLSLFGLKWGDEGKGRWVDGFLAEIIKLINTDIEVVNYRFAGGANAGHTVTKTITGPDGNSTVQKFEHHTLPSTITEVRVKSVLGTGMVIDPAQMLEELDELENRLGRDEYADLYVAERANVVMPWHKILDTLNSGSIGSTGRGIGPAYEDRANRLDKISFHDFIYNVDKFETEVRRITNKRIGRIQGEFNLGVYDTSIVQEDIDGIKKQLDANLIIAQYGELRERILNEYKGKVEFIDDNSFLNDIHQKGGIIFAEGAQGALLDVDIGTIPNVTSSKPGPGGANYGMSILENQCRVGVVKAMDTRVGGGVLLTEADILFDDIKGEIDGIESLLQEKIKDPKESIWTQAEEFVYYNALATGVDPLDALRSSDLRSRLNNEDIGIQKVAKLELNEMRLTIVDWLLEKINDQSDERNDDYFGVLMRIQGNEYGVTTGRPRRNGHQDLTSLDYAVKHTNPHLIALTKLDVLSGIDKLKVCVGYELDGQLYANSEEIEALGLMPSSEEERARVNPIYVEVDGWNRDALNKLESKSLKELKEKVPNAYNYLQLIADYVGVPIIRVGIGPEREQYLEGEIMPIGTIK